MDPLTLARFRQTFSWAVKALILENDFFTDEEKKYPELIMERKKISRKCGPITDRFAKVFSDFFWVALDHRDEFYRALEEAKSIIFLNENEVAITDGFYRARVKSSGALELIHVVGDRFHFVSESVPRQYDPNWYPLETVEILEPYRIEEESLNIALGNDLE